MKKVLFAVFTMLLCLPLLFAGGSNDTAKSDAVPKALILWSAASEAEAQKLVTAFKVKYPAIDVSIIRAGSGELMTRINAEQPRPQGDVLLAIAKENLDMAYDFFIPYKAANHDTIPANLRDSAAIPRYYGFSMPLQAIMVNTKLLTPDKYPKTWKDIADPKYKGEIVLANPALSGSAYAQLYMWYKLYGDEFIKQVAKNATFVASSTAGPEAVARGEYAITATGETNIGNALAKGSPVTYVYPKDGTGARFDGSAIIKNGPNPAAAKLFMDFLTSREAYDIILRANRRTVHPALPGPASLPSLKEITLIPFDDAEAAKIKDELCTQFTEYMKQ